MKDFFRVGLFLVFCGLLAPVQYNLNAQTSFSGLLDSKIIFNAPFTTTQKFSYGIEEYANLRLQAKLSGGAVFYGSFNAIALAGGTAQAAIGTGSYIAGDSYAAALELERLYFHLTREKFDFDGGLMRTAFGFGQIFAPSDFLNPRNPLFPDARNRATLAASASFYPNAQSTIKTFVSSSKNPFDFNGMGTLAGILGEYNWDVLSAQTFYAFEAAQSGAKSGVKNGNIHRAALSIKADVIIGIWLDAIYTAAQNSAPGIKDWTPSAGADYSFYRGKCYVLAEYFYSSAHLLYGLFMFRFNDFFNASAACLAGLDDASFTPIAMCEYEIIQGFTLSANMQFPIDEKHAVITLKGRLRF